jgi:phosphate transporter
VSAPNPRFIFSQMFSPTIMLLIGGFTIAAALSKTRMDAIMAKRILNLAGTSPSMVLLSQMGVATFASMWISNVAAPTLCFALIKVRSGRRTRRGAIVLTSSALPPSQPITEKLPPNSQFTRCLIIAIALASNIGGQASPISSPQNLIALQAMDPELDWLQWFAISLPVASLSILLIWAALHLGYRWEKDLQIPSIKPHGDKFTGVHWFVLSVTLGTIGLWCVEKSLEQYIGDMGIIAIIPLVAFFGTGVLSKDDFHHFQWSIVYLAMGGIALGKAVLSSGLLEDLDAFLEKMVGGLSLWQILAVFSLVVMVIATFISHTIAAVLLVPIASRIGESLEDPHPRLLIMVRPFLHLRSRRPTSAC